MGEVYAAIRSIFKAHGLIALNLRMGSTAHSVLRVFLSWPSRKIVPLHQIEGFRSGSVGFVLAAQHLQRHHEVVEAMCQELGEAASAADLLLFPIQLDSPLDVAQVHAEQPLIAERTLKSKIVIVSAADLLLLMVKACSSVEVTLLHQDSRLVVERRGEVLEHTELAADLLLFPKHC